MGVAGGEVVISRSGVIHTFAAKDAKTVVLEPSSLPWLKNLAKCFERAKWLAIEVEYRPMVGTTTAGSIAVGVDWAYSSSTAEIGLAAVSRDAVLACTPVMDGPVWERQRMTLPASRLQSRQWYCIDSATGSIVDRAPGTLLLHTTADAAVGEVWLHYRVSLSGTRAV